MVTPPAVQGCTQLVISQTVINQTTQLSTPYKLSITALNVTQN